MKILKKILTLTFSTLVMNVYAGSFGSCEYGAGSSVFVRGGEYLDYKNTDGVLYEYYDCSDELILIVQKANFLVGQSTIFLHRYSKSCLVLGEQYVKGMGDYYWERDDSGLTSMLGASFSQKNCAN